MLRMTEKKVSRKGVMKVSVNARGGQTRADPGRRRPRSGVRTCVQSAPRLCDSVQRVSAGQLLGQRRQIIRMTQAEVSGMDVSKRKGD